MGQEMRTYVAIDLKSFYASVECVERGLDPLAVHLVVADESRSRKTICLAVSPSLKALGIPGRPRLFEVAKKIDEVNRQRSAYAPGGRLAGASVYASELAADPSLTVDYLVAPPRMALYMEYSTRIYQIYLRHVAPEDIHVYSIDEVFMDVTDYLTAAGQTPREFTAAMIHEVLAETGITAAAGIGTNLYLAKVAMDIVAKHVTPDGQGVRIAELDEMKYRRVLWDYRPLTDFWRVGRGYAKKLEERGLYTMGDIARCSVGRPDDYYNEELLYRLFGVNAQLLIDHAWGWEPCTMADIKAYRPESGSVGSGQVLQQPYPYEKAKLIVREMADQLALDLMDRGLVTDQLVLTVGYDIENLADEERRRAYKGEVRTDRYGRQVPRHAHGTHHLPRQTASARLIMAAAMELFEQVADRGLLVRRVYLTACRVAGEAEARQGGQTRQLSLFDDYDVAGGADAGQEDQSRREEKLQRAVLEIKKKFGKNAVLRGMDLEEGAMTRERNRQIGGHRA